MKNTILKSIVLSASLTAAIAMASSTDAHTYTENTTGSILVSKFRPEFALELKSNATTGYMWFLNNYNRDLLEPIKHEYIAPKHTMVNGHPMVGAPGHEVWLFRMKPQAFVVPQVTDVQLVYRRVSDNSAESTPLTFNIVTQQK